MTFTIEKAEAIVKQMEDKRQQLEQQSIELTAERGRIALAAHSSGDVKARKRLTEINSALAVHSSELASVESALSVAHKNVEGARADAARAADREKAKAIAVLNARLKEELENADDALADAIGSVLSARDLLMQMHAALGVTSPTDQMFRINAVAALKTALQKLPQPWVNDFEFMRLSPSQKKAFRPLAAGWHDQIANQTAARLGATKKPDQAA